MSDKELYSIADLELTIGSGKKPMDYQSYARLQKNIDKRVKKVGKEESLERRKENTRQWLSSVPKRWRRSNIRELPNYEIVRKMLSKNRLHGFFISGHAADIVNTGYAILRVFVSQGWVSPSMIEVTNEEELLAAVKGGFKGAATLDRVLKKKVFMITLSGKKFYDDREAFFWNRLISQCFEEGGVLILLSDGGFEEFVQLFPKMVGDMLEDLILPNVLEEKATEEDLFSVFEE